MTVLRIIGKKHILAVTSVQHLRRDLVCTLSRAPPCLDGIFFSDSLHIWWDVTATARLIWSRLAHQSNSQFIRHSRLTRLLNQRSVGCADQKH